MQNKSILKNKKVVEWQYVHCNALQLPQLLHSCEPQGTDVNEAPVSCSWGVGFCVTQAPAGSKTALAERAEEDLLIALTGNGPVNIINIITIEPRFEWWLNPLFWLCALKIS